MTDFTKELRGRLADQYTAEPLRLSKEAVSKDGTRKFLFKLHDGYPVESVLIPDDERNTLCISSQSGVRFGLSLLCHRHDGALAESDRRGDYRATSVCAGAVW